MMFEEFEERAGRVRKTILGMAHRTKSQHIGSSFSIVEGLVALYFKYLNNSPDNCHEGDRDRFILGKGHACSALYAVLHERGFLTDDDLEGFAVNGGTLEQHPKYDISRGIEVSTGSLGHGLSIGAGVALGGKNDCRKYKVYTMLSDGDMNEGSTWEAVMFASHHRLANLVALVDRNGIQALGPSREILNLDPLKDKWKAFGWNAVEVNGHDFKEIFSALELLALDRPNVIVMNTIKGKGVSFMENSTLWHYQTLDDETYSQALKELSA